MTDRLRIPLPREVPNVKRIPATIWRLPINDWSILETETLRRLMLRRASPEAMIEALNRFSWAEIAAKIDRLLDSAPPWVARAE